MYVLTVDSKTFMILYLLIIFIFLNIILFISNTFYLKTENVVVAVIYVRDQEICVVGGLS